MSNMRIQKTFHCDGRKADVFFCEDGTFLVKGYNVARNEVYSRRFYDRGDANQAAQLAAMGLAPAEMWHCRQQ